MALDLGEALVVIGGPRIPAQVAMLGCMLLLWEVELVACLERLSHRFG